MGNHHQHKKKRKQKERQKRKKEEKVKRRRRGTNGLVVTELDGLTLLGLAPERKFFAFDFNSVATKPILDAYPYPLPLH
jgi:hypothetical protein